MDFPILSAILLCPLAAVLVIMLIPAGRDEWVRWVSAVLSAIALALSTVLWFAYDPGAAGLQFTEHIPWVPAVGIDYHMAVDGYGVALIMLNSLVLFTGVLTMWTLKVRVKEYFAFMMLLVVGVYGVFMTQDLFLLFFFYEIAVVPMYPLILIWGSTRKEYGAMKLMLFLLVGSALLFPALLAIYHQAGLGTFSLVELGAHTFERDFQVFVYPFVYLGFGVLAGMFPFHGWSPTGHVAAPTAVSMLHAGVLMKLGAFGVLVVGIRLLPEGALYWAPLFAVLAAVGIIYGGFVALRQNDFKFVIGFSSVSHMGIVLLGLNIGVIGFAGGDASTGQSAFDGAVFQMFAHGVMTALFFSTVGYIYETSHSKMIGDFGGLGSQMPKAVSIFIVAGLCGAGLPGLASFWGELLVFLAALATFPLLGAVVVAGLVLTALYVLRVFNQAFFGPPNPKWEGLPDLRGWALLPRALLVAVLVLFGFFPRAMLDLIGSTTSLLAEVF